MKNLRLITALAGLALMITVGCGQKKDDSPAAVTAVGVVGAVPVAAGPPRMPITAYVSQTVAVNGTAQSPLNTGARAFLLGVSSYTANDIGTITGVTIEGDIIVDKTNGSVLPGNPEDIASSIYITITDSFVGTANSSGEIMRPMAGGFKARSGTAANGIASIVFATQTGTVTVNGTYNVVNGGSALSTFQGTISFQSGNGTSGVLGTFSISTCSFFRCQ